MSRAPCYYRQQNLRAPIAVSQFENVGDNDAAVPSSSGSAQSSAGRPPPILRPPPRRDVMSPAAIEDAKYVSETNSKRGNDVSSYEQSNGFSDDDPAKLRLNSKGFGKNIETGLSSDVPDSIHTDDISHSVNASPTRGSSRDVGSEYFISDKDLLMRKETEQEQKIVDATEDRLRRELFNPKLSDSTSTEPSISDDAHAEDVESAGFSLSERLRQEGHIAESKGHHSLASLYYLRSIRLDINNGKAWQNLAKSEGRRKHSMRTGARILRRALEHNPSNAFLWQSLGFLMFRMRQYETARMHFEKGISVDSNHAPLYSTWAHMEFGMGEIEKARELYEKGSMIEHGGARVLQNWGQMEEKLGNSTKALQLYKKGLEKEPNNPYLLETMGCIASKENNYEQARQFFRTALEGNDHMASIYESYADMEAHTGNSEKARELYEEGVAADVKSSRVLRSWSFFEFKVS